MKNFLLNILAFGAILSSILVITSTNPVIAVIFLISVFFNAAGYLILLGVGFIGLSYILLYVGAITVLFLFVIMMINIKLTDILETGSQYTKNFPLALAIGSLFIFEIFTILPFQINNVSIISVFFDLINTINSLFLTVDNSSVINVLTTFNPSIADTTITNFLQIEAIGHNLYTYGAALLIICSVLLLLAMTAPIFISRKSKF
jgi:NADH-ubiquinone oxidoreductase chain 6|uniref:NADH-ubiquinone oxidoreductase chain 6 n=1 Tax=Paxillus involutus TaxID=71150 RepID=A0A5Q0N4Q3_PAXIN|nr:NADH dehydrogenase subunit 6 [Paxillus involutus]QFZ98767.1 NADH dehydrogenase subunit 6 [Paxillus involutus]